MTELLNNTHNRSHFDCGNELLNNYLKKIANQDVKRKLTACFVLVEKETNQIQGYYTLSNNNIPLGSFPHQISMKLPKNYHAIPATLLGQLAVDKNSLGKGIGKLLLIDALKRCFELSKVMGSYAVVVDPIDKDAEMFYSKYGFISLPDSKKMFIAMKTLKLLFA